MSAVSRNAGDPSAVAAPLLVDIGEIVPQARHAYPVELAPGDLLFDASGAQQSIDKTTVLHDGKVVSAMLTSGHRVWLWSDEPIIAVLPRAIAPSITVYERVFDPEDEAGWANGDPRVIDSETQTRTWEPDDGNPIGWALDILNHNGTLEPPASPPFTERTWYSGSGIDFARSGATIDTSAHLAGLTLAEVEQIGAHITAPPKQSTAVSGALSCRAPGASRTRSRADIFRTR